MFHWHWLLFQVFVTTSYSRTHQKPPSIFDKIVENTGTEYALTCPLQLELPFPRLRITPTVGLPSASEVHGVGTDQENLQRYSQLGVGFPESGGSLDESCTFFNFVYLFCCLAILLWCEGHVCDNGGLDIDSCIFKIL